MELSFLNTKVIGIDPAIGNSYRHVLCHFGKPRASLEYAKSSIFDFRPSTRVFDVSNFRLSLCSNVSDSSARLSWWRLCNECHLLEKTP